MKKFLVFVYFLLFIFNASFGQSGTWTWISGDTMEYPIAVYGTLGVPSVNNHPEGMYEGSEWKDKQGNLWVFYGDLWKYSPLTNEWTWVNGYQNSTGQSPIYGTEGLPNTANNPGGRGLGTATWVDTAGNFWLFGGFQYGSLNDLWEYNISTNCWTWMSGNSSGNTIAFHGTMGVPAVSNLPGARYEVIAAWSDSSNCLWLFGGYGYDDINTEGNLNDLWKYNIASNQWTWMKGSQFTEALASYGSKGVSNNNNDPGARWSYTKWKDLNGNFWLMGGYRYSLSDYERYNDLWKFNSRTNQWTWMYGPDITDDNGNYHHQCLFDTLNQPLSRGEQRSSVSDNCGRFWMFGGTGDYPEQFMNDLWLFDPSQLKWEWLNGTNNYNQPGLYGNLGIPSPSNIPQSRNGALAWWGNDNRFYMFGGNTYFTGNIADLWVYTPDTNCVPLCGATTFPPPVANFQTTSTAFCSNACINFTNLSANATSYQWIFSGAIDSTSSDQNPQNICYSKPGIYNVTLIATNAGGSNTVTFSNYINVSPAPPTPIITQHHDSLYCSIDTSYKSYQWYLDSAIITGATDTLLIISQSGNYNLSVTNSSGCNIAVGITVILGLQNYMNDNTISLSPNPATDQLSITGSWKETGNTKLTVFNTLGQIIYTNQINRKQETINCKPFPAGIYFIQVANETGRWIGKFVKE